MQSFILKKTLNIITTIKPQSFTKFLLSVLA